MEKILIIGASGQIGTDLTLELRKRYGDSNVYATDIKQAPDDIVESGPFHILDVMDDKNLMQLKYIIWLPYFRVMQRNFHYKHGRLI